MAKVRRAGSGALAFLVGLSLLLAACGGPAGSLQDPRLEVLEDMRRLGLPPEVVATYGEALENLGPPLAPQGTGDLQLVQAIALGSVAHYEAYYARRQDYPQFDWSRDGCSAPEGLGLGYRETFRPACNVHDFGYRNFPRFPELYNERGRRLADDNFLVNMNAICRPMGLMNRAACYSAAHAYYWAVRAFGGGHFYR
ncbi:phospholipase A2 [Thermus sp.]|uniref:phospholipase A2 n=3 Tax=Thermus sp. TaxID=275 RepID=UPI00298F261A|nr:phospholipase A2 [Thermus sp.]MDW8358507.1 phospholipase A2 [Thermus sp.]